MNPLKIVRSNGAWFIQNGEGNQKISRFYKTLEEARTAAQTYVENLEIIPPNKTRKKKLF